MLGRAGAVRDSPSLPRRREETPFRRQGWPGAGPRQHRVVCRALSQEVLPAEPEPPLRSSGANGASGRQAPAEQAAAGIGLRLDLRFRRIAFGALALFAEAAGVPPSAVAGR